MLGDGYTRRDFPSLSEFSMERFIENTMYASRWLLAPIYFGLSLAVLALSVKFFQELYHILPQIFSLAEAEAAAAKPAKAPRRKKGEGEGAAS